MALDPIDEAHALQIQAGTLGRKAGHTFEDTITERIIDSKYPIDVTTLGAGHVFSGDPASLLLHYIAARLKIRRITVAVAISTGALATSEEGKKWLSINGADVSRCKSDLVVTISSDDRAPVTVGISTKQCNNPTPTNAQLYFTTARGFVALLRNNGINVSEAAVLAMRQFCGDSGFRPSDDPVAVRARKVDPRRFFWEETNAAGRREWERTLSDYQDEVSRLLLQKAYVNDQFVPEYLLHKTKRSLSWSTTEVALYSIDELVTLSRRYQGFTTKAYCVPRSDGAGGVFVGGQFINDEGHSSFPVVNAPFSSVPAGGFVMHVVPASRMVDDVRGEIVMYAQDVTAIQGNWRLEEDPSAALGRRLRNPDAGAAKVTTASATPGDYVEFRFNAEAGVDYHLWMRGRADGDHWANDSVFVQFSDSVDASGAATWRIATTSATIVFLEDSTNAGLEGWGWQDNAYGAGALGAHVRFATTGEHTMRVQRREDGYSFDQIVLSSSRYLTTAPGPAKEASTVLAHSNGQPAPPPPATEEVVLHMTGAQTHGLWVKQARADAASGIVVRHPDAGAAKVVAMPAPPANYFELSFDAEAGRAYRLWIRGIAEGDYWGNDSVHVQFSDSVDASGAARWRIGSGTSTEVNLEDCSGCGLRGWGWQDNGWGVGVAGPPIYFASTGRHVIRVTTREDGFGIDQIVLSPARHLTSSPGALKSDTTILPKTQ
jgi:hypothetical protein